MNNPKVSIVVPVFNVEQYLRQCLNSITKQTLKDIEIICINDGSTDRSLEIINEYSLKDSRIVVINKENSGYGVGMNIGMKIAKGDYIGIVEPDDFISLEMFEALYSIATTNDLDVVKCNFCEYEETKNKIEAATFLKRTLSNRDNYGKVLSLKKHPEIIAENNSYANWAGIYRTDFLRINKIQHHETPGASYQDTGFFWMVFTHADRIYYLDEAYYFHRADNPSSSTNNKGKAFAINIEFDFIKERLLDDVEEGLWNKYKPYYNYKKYGSYCWTIKRLAPELRREFIARMKTEFGRANQLDELHFELFSKGYKESVEYLLSHSISEFDAKIGCSLPATLVSKYEAQLEENKELYKQIQRIRNSKSFRIGKLLLAIPARIRKLL